MNDVTEFSQQPPKLFSNRIAAVKSLGVFPAALKLLKPRLQNDFPSVPGCGQEQPTAPETMKTKKLCN